MRIIPVGELVTYVKGLLETDEDLQDLWVGGETTNVSLSSAGHYYFTLKDGDGQLKCVMFRGQAAWQTLLPQNGQELLAHGRLSLYEVTGSVQLYVDLLQAEGQGQAALEFEQLRARLEADGLFAPERKRPLPAFPTRIGVVTSPQAAAFQDICKVLGRRYPLATIVLAPTLVQGAGAPAGIVGALAALNSLPAAQAVDVIIVARGGGAPDELAAFNDERVVRAVYAARVPVVTGVGHETDTTLVDYVADVRAPTPSAAAELVAPDMGALAADVEGLRRLLWEAMNAELALAADGLYGTRDRLARYSPQSQVAGWRQRLDTLADTARLHLAHNLSLNRAGLATQQASLAALSPAAISRRGYAVVRNGRTGAVLTQAVGATPGDLLELHFQDGVIGAEVVTVPAPGKKK